MHSISLKSSLIALAVFAAFSLGLFAEPLRKEIVIRLFGAEYGRLVFECDRSMRNQLIAKHKIETAPDEQGVLELEAANMALLECHRYDKMRKRLIQLGLTENELAYLGLLAIEARAEDLQEIVRFHEIRN